MKKILSVILAAAAIVSISSCQKSFPHEGTATESLAGTWMCTVYYADNSAWVPYQGFSVETYNTAANLATEMWINDYKGFWGTCFKVDCDPASRTFGKEGKEYTDLYFDAAQHLYGGKVTVGGATAPGSESTVDRIEYFIEFSDDSLDGKTPAPYCTTYYVTGYRYTGFPDDEDEFQTEWPSMPDVK